MGKIGTGSRRVRRGRRGAGGRVAASGRRVGGESRGSRRRAESRGACRARFPDVLGSLARESDRAEQLALRAFFTRWEKNEDSQATAAWLSSIGEELVP